MSALQYEKRVIVFVDFLGFKELIDQTVKTPTLIGHILSAMDHLREVSDDSEFFKSQRVTQFSDCMVISYAAKESSAVFNLINNMGFALVDIAHRGFLLRGAITVGDLLHTKDHVIGPAMVRAYELESKFAKYPRIILDPTVMTAARQSPASHHSSDEEEGHISAFLQKDDDGHEYIEYVNFDAAVDAIGVEADSYPEYLGSIGALLRKGLANTNPGVLGKYLWLYKRYIGQIDLCSKVPVNATQRRDNPEFFDDMEALPRLGELARNAQSTVDLDAIEKVKNG